MMADDPSLVVELRAIARERLARIESLVATLDHQLRPEVHREIARELHTLKGEARIVGLAAVGQRVHEAEDVAVALSQQDDDAHRRALLASLDAIEDALAMDGPQAPSAERLASERDEGTRVSRTRIAQLEEAAAALRSGDAARRELCSEVELLRAELRSLRRTFAQTAGQAAVFLTLDRIDRRAATLASQARAVVGETREHVEELEAASRALALVPIDVLFAPQRALLRRMAQEQGKSVELVVEGVEVELDRDVLEALAPPLLHLVRNAVDHGIETTEARLAAGKSERARVTLAARTDGAEVEITVSDDGAGIDEAAVQARARSLGLDGEGRTAAEHVFAPGLSTRREVGATSGRGVGLDVVMGALRDLGGGAQIKSTPGLGTSVILRVPAARVVASGALLEASGHAWIVPLRSMRAALDRASSKIVRAGSGWVLHRELDGANAEGSGTLRMVPYAPLDALLGIAASAAPTRVVVVGRGEREIALGVTAFRGVVRMTVRRDASLLASLPLICGAALLEDGEAVPMLDIDALLRRPMPEAAVATEHASPRRHVLVVDDSELMRDIAAAALRAMGHEVTEAIDGRHALECIRARAPDLVVTDLDMPVMDGFALLTQLRADPALCRLPVVVFTSTESDASMRRAGALGADAYIVKSRLSREELERSVLGLLRAPTRRGVLA